jgi:hypothetical protein
LQLLLHRQLLIIFIYLLLCFSPYCFCLLGLLLLLLLPPPLLSDQPGVCWHS